MDEQKHICAGCGVMLQTERKEDVGYVPPSALQRDYIVCQRCFRLMHYNEVQEVSLTADDFLQMLHHVGKQNALIVKVVDLFDLNGSWLSGLHRFVGNNDVLLVANKVDLLPKAVNRNRLIHWLKYEAKQLGLKPIDVTLMSAKSGQGIDEVAEHMERYRRGKDVYVVGITNVGKSTFINALISRFSDETDRLVTTSFFPGTTLGMIDITLADGSRLYDTPGIVNEQQMVHMLNEEELKIVIPQNEIKPKTFQLQSGQTLFFGGLARLDFSSGKKTSFTCYMSNQLHVHRTKTDGASSFYKKHLGGLLSPPLQETKEQFPPLKKHTFSIRDEKMDIVFAGLGWVTVHSTDVEVVAYSPADIFVSVRKSLI